MWDVKDRFPAKLMDSLSTSGFVVSSTGGVMRVEKYGCGAEFRRTDDGRKFPAHAEQLVNMRKFNEELRTHLGVPTYYNEALGSTSLVSVYDRVKGRAGDIPDKTVGVKPITGH